MSALARIQSVLARMEPVDIPVACSVDVLTPHYSAPLGVLSRHVSVIHTFVKPLTVVSLVAAQTGVRASAVSRLRLP